MHKPIVSVILPVYNEEKYIGSAVDSILSQSLKNIELIIIDDGSTDKTLSILQTYKKDSRVRIVSQENSGLATALNNGIAISQGKYIARQDADDLSVQDRLEKQVNYMDLHPDIGILGSNYHTIDENDNILATTDIFTHPIDIVIAEISSNQFGHGAIMIRKAILNENKYDKNFKVAQDYDLWSRLIHYTKAANLKEPLYFWRTIGAGQSTKPENLIILNDAETNIRIREFAHFLDKHNFILLFHFRPWSTRGGFRKYMSMKNTMLRNMSLLYSDNKMWFRAQLLLFIAILISPKIKKTYAQLQYTAKKDPLLNKKFNKEYI